MDQLRIVRKVASVDGCKQCGARKEIGNGHTEKHNQDGDEYFGKKTEETRNLFLETRNAEDADTYEKKTKPGDPKNGAAKQLAHGR